jgi:5-methylcytosine-specific restriction endonuclease McrA
MERHCKIYKDYLGLEENEWRACEVCGRRANDIHHIFRRGEGGTDEIGNLIALCRRCHRRAHGMELDKGYLTDTHKQKLNIKGNGKSY